MQMDGKEGLCIAARTVGFALKLNCCKGDWNKKLLIHSLYRRGNYSLHARVNYSLQM